VQPLADLTRLEYLRLVNYALPGILADDLKIDTSGYDPTQQGTIDSLLTTSVNAAGGPAKTAKKKAAPQPATTPVANRPSRAGSAGSE
jgi:hypothetical protein